MDPIAKGAEDRMEPDRNGALIFGAGPSGMAAAFELHKAGKPFIVIEKNDSVGGLARTFHYGEFRTDLGPHRFFSQNQFLYDFIEDLLGESWIKVDRLTRFYIHGRFFSYPVDFKNALTNVGVSKALTILMDYLWERGKKLFLHRDPASFEEKVVGDFGRALADLNMLNYTQKIWGMPCSEISAEWANQRIKGLSLLELMRKAVTHSKGGPKTLVDQFYYPDKGTWMIYEKIKERIGDGGAVKLKSYPVKIIHKDMEIRRVIVSGESFIQDIKPEYVISSIPITELVNLLEPRAPDEVLRASEHLKYRSHVSLFLTLDKTSIFPDQWIYLPDKEIPFGRIMEPKNFSNQLSPPGKTSLLIEFFCWENDEVWKARREELFQLSIGWLEKLGFVKRREVMNSFVHRERYAYPVYDLHYQEHLGKVKNYLGEIKNLQLIGRAGCFRYNNQDHALEMGILAARNIIEGRKGNIEEIGREQEYFEKGYIKHDRTDRQREYGSRLVYE